MQGEQVEQFVAVECGCLDRLRAAPTESPEEIVVTIELSPSEALVLFDALARSADRGGDSLLLEHEAEKRVLAGLLCLLEKELAEPLSADYHKLLSDARADLL